MSKELGDYGENLAAEFLQAKGYKIIDRNFRTKQGEIDIIADESGVICIVEVKYKVDEGFGSAIEMIPKSKMEKILKTAKAYLYEKDLLEADYRIDVVAIDGNKDECELIRNVYLEGMGF